MAINRWWITDEVRYGWKFVHSEDRLRSPMRRQFGALVESDYTRAYDEALAGLRAALVTGGRVACVISPNLPCEEAFALATLAREIDPQAILALGPIPTEGKDQTFPPGAPENKAFRVYAEKAPNARGVKRILEAVAKQSGKAQLVDLPRFTQMLKSGQLSAAIITGNYPSEWAPTDLLDAVRQPGVGGGAKPTVIVIDTLASQLSAAADILLPSSTWLEKAGTFENARNMLQAFEAAIPPVEPSKPEAQIALDLMAVLGGAPALIDAETIVINPAKAGQVPDATRILDPVSQLYNAPDTRAEMATLPGLESFATGVATPTLPARQQPDMQMVEL
jgi:NADH-quinone oxidoreductase subunit G